MEDIVYETDEGTWTIQVVYPDDNDSTSFITDNDLTFCVPETENIGALSPTELKCDLSRKTPEKPSEMYVCRNCHKAYNAKRNLVRHMNSECGKEPKYRCYYCEYRNYRRNEIMKHVRKKHGLEMKT